MEQNRAEGIVDDALYAYCQETANGKQLTGAGSKPK
jgi:hypothetical protein